MLIKLHDQLFISQFCFNYIVDNLCCNNLLQACACYWLIALLYANAKLEFEYQALLCISGCNIIVVISLANRVHADV